MVARNVDKHPLRLRPVAQRHDLQRPVCADGLARQVFKVELYLLRGLEQRQFHERGLEVVVRRDRCCVDIERANLHQTRRARCHRVVRAVDVDRTRVDDHRLVGDAGDGRELALEDEARVGHVVTVGPRTDVGRNGERRARDGRGAAVVDAGERPEFRNQVIGCDCH